MKNSPHIVIIGAGLIGLSCADALISRGAKVTILEKREGPVLGTSFANSGMLHPSQARSWSPDMPQEAAAAKSVLALANRSKGLLIKNMARLGLAQMATRPKGCVQLYSDLGIARLEALQYEAMGVQCKTIVDPLLSFGLPAVLFPDDLSGNAYDYGAALAKALEAWGAEIKYGVTDISLRQHSGGIALRYGGVRLQPDHVIVAAGTDSEALLKEVDISMSLLKVRGHSVTFAKPDINLPDIPVMDVQSRSALTLFGDRLRLSGGWGIDTAKPILNRWAEIAPDMMSRLTQALGIWSADRPVSKAGRPYVSATSAPGLWINTGHGHMGWTLCAGSGALMADMILDGHQDGRFVFAG